MKIRNGFVSNSSSASFIISWNVDTDAIPYKDDEQYKDRCIKHVLDYIRQDDDNLQDITKHTIYDDELDVFITHSIVLFS